MMKHILIIWFCLLNMYPYALYAEDANAQQYQDSILKIAQSMPGTLPKLTYLRDMAYRHQYAPYNKTFSTALYQEACIQKNIIYENLGAYYLASCYDKLHDADSLAYWVDKLEKYAPEVGTYDYYLEQKAAISRALASKRQIEKAVYVAKETLAESLEHNSNNGEIASYNSLGCAYGVSSRVDEALNIFLKAYQRFTPRTKTSLRVDILSRIAQVYGNTGRDSLRRPYVQQMDEALQEVITREPETRKNWSNFEIDCQIKYVLLYMNKGTYHIALEHINKAKALLEDHVDPVFWLNVQLVQLQYYARTQEYDKSIALIDEVTPVVLNHYVSTFATLINYKASTQIDKGDIDGAIETKRYLIRTQDSLDNAFSANQLRQMKEIYHIDDLLLEKQKIKDTNYKRGFLFLITLLVLILIFYLYTRYISRKIAAAEKVTVSAAMQAEADNTTKDRLQSEISHDIRTPLNVVVGFAELLTESKELTAEAKVEYGKMIQENAENLLTYVNSILELSRLESGKTQYVQEECELIELCRKEITIAEQSGNGRVTVRLKTDVENRMISTDKNKFSSLLSSLLVPSENDENTYNIVIRIRYDKEKNMLFFRVTGTPLAKARFENKTALIRHEINAHFVHAFNGTYKVQEGAAEGPLVLFSIQAANQVSTE
jgi:signal transduction histidine kinase